VRLEENGEEERKWEDRGDRGRKKKMVGSCDGVSVWCHMHVVTGKRRTSG
jgi:hypothetical protein